MASRCRAFHQTGRTVKVHLWILLFCFLGTRTNLDDAAYGLAAASTLLVSLGLEYITVSFYPSRHQSRGVNDRTTGLYRTIPSGERKAMPTLLWTGRTMTTRNRKLSKTEMCVPLACYSPCFCC